MLIVAALAKGAQRLSELREAIPEISEKVLIRTLQELQYHQIFLEKSKLKMGIKFFIC
jgi:DNA-binding HxlR family transcriptional regulator